MPIDILMPALSPTMEKGNLAKWLKKEGDVIKSGDILAEIETDKATMEVEAVDEGVLAKIVVPDGSSDVPVNQVIGIIAQEGEDASAVSAPKTAPTKAPEPAKADAMVLREERPGSTPGAPVQPAAAKANGGSGARVFASPLARRIAKQAGLDVALIKGSGPHGRVVERDVREAEKAGPQTRPASAPSPSAAPAAASAPKAASMSDETIKKFFEPGTYEEVPHDGMRKTIARRLVEAKQTIPHFYLSVDCELDALLALREQINKSAPLTKEGKPSFKVSVNDFIIKGLALALQRVPDANATWTEGAMLKHRHSDVGVAVSIPGGLITPVVRKAEQKTLSAISNEMKDYAARAKARKLKPEEYQGGTSAVSNLGMFGIKNFSAVINPPHATILAVGVGEKRVVVKDGAPAVATVMSVTLSTDHRAVDGALGAELISAFKALIEAPMGMLV
ncbi:pyruvate dehydrogenase complex dihydrolipoamide acetyltransferase [Beijerinckia sp. L45]|uniref:pyruvate dehydrogenase complex dihydrolipoamide acetyltransferase n=1 Tax=Beijerinckia sp. L45 TaxID=1641855 RepID=UPI00131ADDF2|nr:pyruvate dehydrogenase complex dihydrolipoamide acetyltransferase [Beijerinckia sp. L45]